MRASEKYALRPELLRTHPILKRLLTLKQSLSVLEDLDFNAPDDEDEDDSSEMDELDDLDDILSNDTWKSLRKQGLEAGELEELIAAANEAAAESSAAKGKAPPRKKRKTDDQKSHPKAPVYDVEEPTLTKPGRSTVDVEDASADPYGEATVLDSADAADKGSRRKALRFHTSKIESASARRQGARTAQGGDDDIPYRERRKQQEERAAKARTNLGAGGDDLDDAEPEARETKKRGRDDDGGDDGSEEDGDDDDGYYSLVKKQKAAKKAEKKARYEEVKEATR